MRKLIMLAAILAAILAAMPAMAAESRYEAIVSVLNAKGEFDRNVIVATRGGVSRAECELRAEAWLAEFGPGLEAAKAQLASAGKGTAFTVDCERVQ